MKTIILNRFGGVANDPRKEGNFSRACTNFDILTSPYRLLPYRSSESGDSSASTSQKQAFAVGLWTPGSDYRVFALGRQSAVNRAEVLMKAFTTGASDDLDDATWASPNGNQGGVATPAYNFFVYYKKRAKFFGLCGQKVFAFTPDGSTAWDDDITSTDGAGSGLTYTNSCQGLVHSKDDIMYFGVDNIVVSLNNATWNKTALTLPSHLYITSLSEYGNYLAIGCAPLSGVGNSVVYLWDRDSTFATLSESIDWGQGNLKVLEEISGYLVGISFTGGNTTRFKDKIIFKVYAGMAGAQTFEVLESDTTASAQLQIAKQKIDQRIYFMMSVNKNGSLREGVWSVGRTGEGWSIVHERTPNNDTALTGSAQLRNFIFIGDYLFQAYQETNFAVTKTDDQASFTATSIYETKINPQLLSADKTQLIKIMAVGALYDAIPSGGSIVVKHRVLGGTYKTLFTESTAGKTYFEPITIYSDGTQLTDDAKEHEFRIESTGGAVFAALVVRVDEKSSNA